MSDEDDLTFNQQAFVDNIGCDPEMPGVSAEDVAAYERAKKFSEEIEPLFTELAELVRPIPSFDDDGYLISGETVNDGQLAAKLIMDSGHVMEVTRKIDLKVDRFIEDAKAVLDLPVAREYIEELSLSNREMYLNAKMTASQVKVLAKENGVDVDAHILKAYATAAESVSDTGAF